MPYPIIWSSGILSLCQGRKLYFPLFCIGSKVLKVRHRWFGLTMHSNMFRCIANECLTRISPFFAPNGPLSLPLCFSDEVTCSITSAAKFPLVENLKSWESHGNVFGTIKYCKEKNFFFVSYLHVQCNIFLNFKTWEFKEDIFPSILWFSNLLNICCGGRERILATRLLCLHNTCWNWLSPILEGLQAGSSFIGSVSVLGWLG